MKKIALLAIFLLIFLSNLDVSFATSNLANVKDSVASQSSGPRSASDYRLPYPGLLPDSPLYFFRIIRDKTVGFLISDARKKAEFNLLQADKRLNAGIYLFNSANRNDKKIKLAISTISKAENYFEEALEKKEEAKIQGIDISEIERKLISASLKHQEELGKLVGKADKNYKQNFEKELKRVMGFEARLSR